MDDVDAVSRADARPRALDDSSGRSVLSCCAFFLSAKRVKSSLVDRKQKKNHHSSLFLVSIIRAI